MLLSVLILGIASFVISFIGTAAMKRVSPRIGFVDKPGHRKIHRNPIPLGGGVAIFLAFALPMLAIVIGVMLVDPASPKLNMPAEQWAAYIGGARSHAPLALSLLGAMLVMHLMGLIDDRRAL